MADTLDDPEFWLPTEFLTDDDILMDKENFNKKGFNNELGLNLSFPTGFPYDYRSFGASSVLNSPVESVVGSTETESDEEDLLMAGLTRQLTHSTLHETQKINSTPQNFEKTWVLSGSPQSTLTSVGCWSGRSTGSSNGSPNGPSLVSSPPTTPFGKNDSWDLIYAAAGQVARLKMNGDTHSNARGLLAPPRVLTPVHPSPPVRNPNTGFYSNQRLSDNVSYTNHFQQVRPDQKVKQQSSAVWGDEAKEGYYSHQPVAHSRGSRLGIDEYVESGRCGKPVGLAESAWPTMLVQRRYNQNQKLQNNESEMISVFLGGSGGGGLKKECAGTGVFLPRRYGNTTESRKRPAYPTTLLPARTQPPNRNFDDTTAYAQPRSHPRLDTSFMPNYDALMARRNALLTQQKRSITRPETAMHHEIRLPQEWTY